MADKEFPLPSPDEMPMFRIDAAHPISSSAPARNSDGKVPQEKLAAVAANSDAAEERARNHATQLAQHLQERRREVDHRESHLNARIAQLENELRTSRLWLQERTDEFSSREAELSKQLAEQESRLRGLTATELALDDTRQRQLEALHAKETELRCREELLAQTQRQVTEQEKSVVARCQQVDDQEQSLDKQWKELHAQREIHEREMVAGREELTVDRQALGEHRHQLEELEIQQKKAWEARQRQFDDRQIAFERIRKDILKLHREALEMRLVAEQLWSQLTGRVPPSDLTQGIAHLRGQLADEFRFAQQDITTQRNALEALITKLDTQRTAIANQRDELVRWLGHRQQELAQQAEQLSTQEKSLAHERRQHQRQEKRWQTERHELQREIRRLTLEIRKASLVAA